MISPTHEYIIICFFRLFYFFMDIFHFGHKSMLVSFVPQDMDCDTDTGTSLERYHDFLLVGLQDTQKIHLPRVLYDNYNKAATTKGQQPQGKIDFRKENIHPNMEKTFRPKGSSQLYPAEDLTSAGQNHRLFAYLHNRYKRVV